MDPSIERFVNYLDRHRIRATYRAVAEAAGVVHRNMEPLLGRKCPRASWIVSATTGEPTGYADSEKHPDLHRTTEIIRTSEDLVRRMNTEDQVAPGSRLAK